EHATQMRRQVAEICRGLASYSDLIDRLSEEEMVRLTQAPPKTVRFWLLWQPRSEAHTAPASTSGTFDQPQELQPAAPDPAGGRAAQQAVAHVRPPGDSVAPDDDDDDFDPVLSFEDDDEDD